MGALVRRARTKGLVVSTGIVLTGALLIGWFVPNGRYDILALLLIVVAISLGALFRRLEQLKREVDKAVAFRLRAEETAQAFGNPDWDYDTSSWRESAWTRPATEPILAPLSNAELPRTNSVFA